VKTSGGFDNWRKGATGQDDRVGHRRERKAREMQRELNAGSQGGTKRFRLEKFSWAKLVGTGGVWMIPGGLGIRRGEDVFCSVAEKGVYVNL